MSTKISNMAATGNQICIFEEIFEDTKANEMVCMVTFNELPQLLNQTRLQIARSHISLLISIMNRNSGESLEQKIISNRPTLGIGASTSMEKQCNKDISLRLDLDNYYILKTLLTINWDDNVSNVGDIITNEIDDKMLSELDDKVVGELMHRLEKKYKALVFNYGQTPIVGFYKYNNTPYDLITCLTVKILTHPRLMERLDIIFKIRPIYISSINSINSINKQNILCINNDGKYQINKIIIHIQEFIEMMHLAFEDMGTPDMEMLEAELFLHCGISYDLMMESVLNFNKFQLIDMDAKKLLGFVPDKTITNTNTATNTLTKDIAKTLNNIKIFGIKYNDTNLSHDFDGGSNLLFHGSPMINWHSLLYNGPYVPNKSNKLIDNGAVYGIGIYLSPNSNTSIGFTGSKLVNKIIMVDGISIDKYGNDKVMMGIFQIKGNMSRYKKASSVYVCPDTDQLCLKYLIYGDSNSIQKINVYLDKFIKYGAETIVKDIKQKQGMRGAKRLMGEIKQMTARDGKLYDDGLKFNFKLVGDSINIWNITLPMEDNFKDSDYEPNSNNQPDIYKDAKKYKVANLEIEITFPDNYPFAPPFVRIVSPRFKFMTGHITSGGSVCTELLTHGGWVATTCVISLILMLKQNMYNGKARIDDTKLGQVYGYQEATAAYNRMLTNHPEWQAKPTSRR